MSFTLPEIKIFATFNGHLCQFEATNCVMTDHNSWVTHLCCTRTPVIAASAMRGSIWGLKTTPGLYRTALSISRKVSSAVSGLWSKAARVGKPWRAFVTMAEKSCPAGTTNHAIIHAGCLQHKGPCESIFLGKSKAQGTLRIYFWGKSKAQGTLRIYFWKEQILLAGPDLYHTHPTFAGSSFVLTNCALKFNVFRL